SRRDQAVRLADVVAARRLQRMAFLQRIDAAAPVRTLAVRDPRRQRRERIPDVRLDPDVRRSYLAELRTVDVDMDHLRFRTECVRLAGGTIVEARAGRDQQIALVERHVRAA